MNLLYFPYCWIYSNNAFRAVLLLSLLYNIDYSVQLVFFTILGSAPLLGTLQTVPLHCLTILQVLYKKICSFTFNRVHLNKMQRNMSGSLHLHDNLLGI